MRLLEAFVAFAFIPALVGTPVYLGFVLWLSLRAKARGMSIFVAVALVGWSFLFLELLLLPALGCTTQGCNADGHMSYGFIGYALACAALVFVTWRLQRGHERSAAKGAPRLRRSVGLRETLDPSKGD